MREWVAVPSSSSSILDARDGRQSPPASGIEAFWELERFLEDAAQARLGLGEIERESATKVVRRGKGEKANKKKMATVAAVHSQAPAVRTPKQVLDSLFQTAYAEHQPRARPNHKRVWASLVADKDMFITDVKAEMTRRDPHHRRTWVILTDGERALQRRVCQTFNGVTLILDLLHVLEKLWKVAHVLHPEGSPEAEAFVYQRAERILCGMVSQVVKGLRQTVTKRRLTGANAKAIRDVVDYYRNRERMRYDVYLRNGWPIASGTVEGACKNLIRDRFERSGMRWTQRRRKRSYAYAPSTSQAISTPTGSSTSTETSSAYTPPGKSS